MGKLSFEELVNLFLLLSVDRIGPAKIRTLLSKFRSIKNILNAPSKELEQVEGISRELSSRIRKAVSVKSKAEKFLEQEIKKLEKIGARIITVWDEEFPSLLKKIYDPPLLLYVIGNFAENDQYSISVVGTRGPSNYGKLQTERIVSDLATQKITIVSGLARGIDSLSHKTALKNGSRTIAFIGSGLDVIYPPENKKLFEEICDNGAVISEFTLGTKPDAVNFPKRNRLISGFSLGTLIVETGITGGAMQTARLALDQNREVFAIPGNLGVKQSEGTNLLIQRGEAELITSAEDILNELELKLKPIIGKNIPKPEKDLNIFESKIYQSLTNEPLHIDKISEQTNLSVSDCLVYLLSLEFKGLVKQLPGKVFGLV